MNRDALRWTAAIFLALLLAPLVFYLVTGSILGFFLPCGENGILELVHYRGEALSMACSTAKLIIGLVVAFWGTSVLAFLMFLYGYGDIFPREGRHR